MKEEMNKNKIILDLCGGTGAWSKYYKKVGYDVRVITLPDYDITKTVFSETMIIFRSNPKSKIYKEMKIKYKDIYVILAAPPCTHFSIARNDKTAKEKRDFRKGMELVIACLNIIWECRYKKFRKTDRGLKFWALENPKGYLIDFIGKPYLEFHPYEYGDPYTKKTCLWGNFNIPKKNPIKPRNFEHPTTKGAKDFVSCVEHFADLKDIPKDYKKKTNYSNRAIMRSMTPQGFAQAFYEANK